MFNKNKPNSLIGDTMTPKDRVKTSRQLKKENYKEKALHVARNLKIAHKRYKKEGMDKI